MVILTSMRKGTMDKTKVNNIAIHISGISPTRKIYINRFADPR